MCHSDKKYRTKNSPIEISDNGRNNVIDEWEFFRGWGMSKGDFLMK